MLDVNIPGVTTEAPGLVVTYYGAVALADDAPVAGLLNDDAPAFLAPFLTLVADLLDITPTFLPVFAEAPSPIGRARLRAFRLPLIGRAAIARLVPLDITLAVLLRPNMIGLHALNVSLRLLLRPTVPGLRTLSLRRLVGSAAVSLLAVWRMGLL